MLSRGRLWPRETHNEASGDPNENPNPNPHPEPTSRALPLTLSTCSAASCFDRVVDADPNMATTAARMWLENTNGMRNDISI